MTRPGGVVTATELLNAELTAVRAELATERSRNGGLRTNLTQQKAKAAKHLDERDAAVGELAAARAEIEKLRAVLAQAEQYARDLQDEGVVPAGAAVVLRAYEAWQCFDGGPNCRRRYFEDDPDHACGPLTPVTVTVSRRPAS